METQTAREVVAQGVRATQSHDNVYSTNASTEENKPAVSVKTGDSHDGLISIIVTPQTAPDTLPHRSRFRSEKAEKSARNREQRKPIREGSAPLTPQRTKKTFNFFSEDESDSDVQLKTTPPLSPHVENSSDPPNVVGSDGIAVTPLILPCPPPESPYNPLQTPSFRHSPAPPPLYKPWRYPSPSHPLHSNGREIFLTVLARPQGTPLVKGETTTSASPLRGIDSSPLSTAVATPTSSSSFFKSAKRSHLFDQISSPRSAGTSFAKRQRILSSPFPLTTRRTNKGHRRHPSDSSEFWLSDESLVPSKSGLPVDPTPTDSFTIYETWPITGGVAMISPVRPLKRPMELDSPVVRSGSFTSLTSDLPLLQPPIDDVDEDLKEILLSSPALNAKQTTPVATISEFRPPSKKRKVTTIQ
jgi:hypothetical protein